MKGQPSPLLAAVAAARPFPHQKLALRQPRAASRSPALPSKSTSQHGSTTQGFESCGRRAAAVAEGPCASGAAWAPTYQCLYQVQASCGCCRERLPLVPTHAGCLRLEQLLTLVWATLCRPFPFGAWVYEGRSYRQTQRLFGRHGLLRGCAGPALFIV